MACLLMSCLAPDSIAILATETDSARLARECCGGVCHALEGGGFRKEYNEEQWKQIDSLDCVAGMTPRPIAKIVEEIRTTEKIDLSLSPRTREEQVVSARKQPQRISDEAQKVPLTAISASSTHVGPRPSTSTADNQIDEGGIAGSASDLDLADTSHGAAAAFHSLSLSNIQQRLGAALSRTTSIQQRLGAAWSRTTAAARLNRGGGDSSPGQSQTPGSGRRHGSKSRQPPTL